MPTLQDLVRTQTADPTTLAPTVPTRRGSVMGSALLPEANLAAPPSATQAIEQLARERYGSTFVDDYGDVLGFRPKTFTDRLRNAFEILATGNPAAPREAAIMGARARAQLEDMMIREARQKRQDMMNLLSFIPQALRAKMQPKTVASLFAEHFAAITGEEPHPGVIDALVEMQQRGDTPVEDLLGDEEITANELRDLGVDISAFMRWLDARERRKLRERAITERGERAAQREEYRERSLALRKKGLKLRELGIRRGQPLFLGGGQVVVRPVPSGTTVTRED